MNGIENIENKKELVTYLESEPDSDSESEFLESEMSDSESELLEVDGS